MAAQDRHNAGIYQYIQDLAKDTSACPSSPQDVIINEGFSLNLTTCIMVCMDLGIFMLLDKMHRPITAVGLAQTVNAEELLVIGHMRAVLVYVLSDWLERSGVDI